MDSLFTSGTIKDLEIKNRIVLPPMVCFKFSDKNGFVSEKHVDHYEAIVKGGTGLIIVEATCVSKDGKLSTDQLGIWDDKFIDGLSEIVKVCHENDTKVFIQIHHAGLRTPKAVTEDTISSSDYEDKRVSARAMTIDEIHRIEKDFINAAIRAEKAGFDGIEIHGAHSYLLTQFFSEKVNNRKDEYGGSFDNRLKIGRNIFEGIKKEVKDDFIIGIRMGCNENGLETSIEMAKEFEKMGMDYLNVSTGFDNTKIDVELPEYFPCNWIVYGGTKIKENVNIPVIGVNEIKKPEQARYLIDNDLLDFVAIGRSQLADYNYTNNIKNHSIVKCLECRPCRWFTEADTCPKK